MSLPKPTIVLFDMDGTTVRHLNPKLLNILEWLDDIYFKAWRLFSWIFEKKTKGPLILEDHSKKPRLLVHRALHKMRRKSVEQIVEPCPGIYSVLNLLAAHDLPIGLVSSGLGKGYGHDVLKKFELKRFFKATIFREDIKKSKPNPEPLLVALNHMKVKPTENDIIWYIGDRHKDIRAALAANNHSPAKFIPIAYGFNAAVAIIEQGQNAEQIVMCYYDLHNRLCKLFCPEPDSCMSKAVIGTKK